MLVQNLFENETTGMWVPCAGVYSVAAAKGELFGLKDRELQSYIFLGLSVILTIS